jgi:hypothetical protein
MNPQTLIAFRKILFATLLLALCILLYFALNATYLAVLGIIHSATGTGRALVSAAVLDLLALALFKLMLQVRNRGKQSQNNK